DRRMRVEPEQVLEEYRIAAQRRVENAKMEAALQDDQQQRHHDHRGAQHLDDAGGIHRPDEQRQPEPGETWSAQAVNGDDEIQTGEDRREAGAGNTTNRHTDARLSLRRATRY